MGLANTVAKTLSLAGIEANECASAVTCQIGNYRHTVHTYIRSHERRWVDFAGFPIGKGSEDTTEDLIKILEKAGLVEKSSEGRICWTTEALRLSVAKS